MGVDLWGEEVVRCEGGGRTWSEGWSSHLRQVEGC